MSNLYRQGKYQRASYWNKISFPFVVVVEDLNYGTSYGNSKGGSSCYESSVYGAQTFENANKRVEKLKSEYTYRTPNRYKFHVVTQDHFNNHILAKLRAGHDPGDIDGMSTPTTVEKNKPLWPVFNLTNGTFVAAFGDEQAAEAKANELARKTPDTKFLICKPHSIAFQPVQVTIERVKLD